MLDQWHSGQLRLSRTPTVQRPSRTSQRINTQRNQASATSGTKEAAGAWVDELPSVLWGLRTTPNRSTRSTPFFLVYGSEAVLPSDHKHNAPRIRKYTEVEAEEAR